MRKVLRNRQFMLTLPGLLLFAAFLIGGGAEALIGGIATASAAGSVEPARADLVLLSQNHASCNAERRGPSFGSAEVITSGEVICSDLTSFGGSVVIRGEVNGDVVTFAGDVVIDGEVNGNVTTYAGNLTLQEGAHVKGDIHVCGGSWTDEGTHSQFHGNVFSCTKSLGVLLTSDSGTNVRFWSIIIWIVLGMAFTSLLPEHVMLVRTTVKSKLRRSFALGVLSVLLAPAVLTILVALVISLPLAILITIGLLAAWTLGMVAIGWLLGDSLVRSVAPHHNSRLTSVVVGMVVLALAGSLPIIGLWVNAGAAVLGIGAVFLSRFGTRLYGPPRHPLPL
jgi:hypothetical protein